MGARIAAQLANAGIPTDLLDVVPSSLTDREQTAGLTLASPQVRNRIALAGLEAAKKSRPAAFFVPDHARRITVGNFEDHLSRVADADWIIEAVVENLEVKRSLLARVDQLRRPGSIVSTNTSGLPVNQIAEGLGQDFRRHWLGTHFFNPPRYLHLLELIPGRDTLTEVVERLAEFAEQRLGKGIILAKDTPNFIANRIGTFSLVNLMRLVEQEGLTVEEVDALTGPAVGAPKTATFRLLNLVGLDTAAHVIGNIFENAPEDERRDFYRVPPFLQQMLQRNWLGDKTRQGFYKKVGKGDGQSEILALDLKTLEYRPRQRPNFPLLETIRNVDDPAERLRLLLNSEDRAGRFAWKAHSEVFLYAARRIPEISDRILEIDQAMKWGFGWELGPFEMWDALGLAATVGRLEKEGRDVPENVRRMLAAGAFSFYRRHNGRAEYFDFGSGTYFSLEQPADIIVLADEKQRSRLIRKNPGASLVDLGDGVCCVEFHSKMNAIGPDIVAMLQAGLEETGRNFEAMVIANQGANFSVGANLMLALMAIQSEEWEELELFIRQFQNVTQALKYSERPVVVAPFGMTLGGGCEIPLHAARICAHAELYTGLVETSVGLIPAAGGCKEMLIRANEAAGSDADIFEPTKEIFQQTAFAKVSTSAEEARRFRFLRPSDSITMNRDRLVADAKALALEMVRSSRSAPAARLRNDLDNNLGNDLRVVGEAGLATLKLGIHLARQAERITDHDALVARKLAHVLSGGNLSGNQRVSEQYLLDLEREAFLSLCGEKKTQERIAHTLKTGKPLRN